MPRYRIPVWIVVDAPDQQTAVDIAVNGVEHGCIDSEVVEFSVEHDEVIVDDLEEGPDDDRVHR
jgi:hypothetical protein